MNFRPEVQSSVSCEAYVPSQVYILGYIARAVLYKVPAGSSSENGSVEVQGKSNGNGLLQNGDFDFLTYCHKIKFDEL